MPATDEEVMEAEEEGIGFEFLAAPLSVRVEDGKFTGLDCIRMKLGEVDASGRRRPVAIEGSEFFVPADTVLSAIGEGPEFEGFDLEVERDDWVVKTGPFGGTDREGFYAGGDVIESPHTVAHALEKISDHGQKKVKCPECKSTRVEQVFTSIFVKTSRKS